jgi:hypothetical protein
MLTDLAGVSTAAGGNVITSNGLLHAETVAKISAPGNQG